jgi:hypothetical protein
VLEARVAHVGRRRRNGQRGRDRLQPPRFLRTTRRLLLCAAALDLLERESGLVCEAPRERVDRRIRVRQDAIPGDDEDELGLAAPDRDRRPER